MFGHKEMKINTTSGTADGLTQLAAFDAALIHAGIANLNLIKLSSVIPPNSVLEICKPEISEDHYGKKLYVVLSEKRESEKGREAWAGIGWVQGKNGRGLFVEQHGAQQAEVMRLIRDTLTNMVKNRGAENEYGPINYHVVGIACEDKPVCALVAAVYQVEDWNS